MDVIGSQDTGDESSPDPLDFVRRWLPAREHGAFHRLDGNGLEGGFFRLDILDYAGQRPARPDAGDQNIHLVVRVVPDFRPGCLKVNFGIRWIIKLLEHFPY